METRSIVQEPVGELLAEERFQLTGITEYGVGWEDLLSGRVPPPREGAYFDLSFRGELTGERLSGTIEGIDYLQVRADGRYKIHVHATVTTAEGDRIALIKDGLLILPDDDSGVSQIRLTVSFGTASPRYAWLNRREVRVIGRVDGATGVGSTRFYLI